MENVGSLSAQGGLDEAIEACQIALRRAQGRLTEAHPLVSMIQADLEQFQKALHPQKQQNQALNGEASGPKRRLGLRTQVTW